MKQLRFSKEEAKALYEVLNNPKIVLEDYNLTLFEKLKDFIKYYDEPYYKTPKGKMSAQRSYFKRKAKKMAKNSHQLSVQSDDSIETKQN